MEVLREEKLCRCVGVDISDTAIRIVKEKGFEAHVSKLPNLPVTLKHYGFDACLLTETLEHLSDPGKTLQAIAQQLKVDGQLIVSVPDDCMGPEQFDEHVMAFDEGSLRALLNQDFSVDRTLSYQYDGRRYLIVAARRVAARSRAAGR